MRISTDKASLASEIIVMQCSSDEHIWIISSRANDGQLGGDIDFMLRQTSVDVMPHVRCRAALTK
jgi:hypothetical protein